MKHQWNDKIFDISSGNFNELALEIFRFQYANNAVYQGYTDSLHLAPGKVKSIQQIPFLPIRFYKSQDIRSTLFEPEIIFESSGTTGVMTSRHLVKDAGLYRESFSRGFELFYGSPSGWCILGLLPSYLERKNSSLAFMVSELIRQSGHATGGFYLDEFEKLAAVIKELEKQKQKTLLIGVTFALLDFGEKFRSDINREALQHVVIMETGGMKGRGKERVRPEVDAVLKDSFRVPVVHSEYGMTELLSQAYSKGEGIFQCPPWMKVLVREEDDPFDVKSGSESLVRSSESGTGQRAHTGAINIIDLANIYSCSFIATDDAGRIFPDGSFEVLGRLDNSDLRGCSLLTV
jgi:phenylacetate-coenzyme A ligase PaaK-like adenylate-forming protein